MESYRWFSATLVFIYISKYKQISFLAELKQNTCTPSQIVLWNVWMSTLCSQTTSLQQAPLGKSEDQFDNAWLVSSDSMKLVCPRSSTDEKVGGPVKNMGGPMKLLYITMFKIGKSWKNLKDEKFSRCLLAAVRCGSNFILWPTEIIWRQGSRSTLAQVMACCLTAPSHYLNQCWLMISEEVLWHSLDSNFIENT